MQTVAKQENSSAAVAVPLVPKHTPGPWQCYADLPSVEPNWHIVTNASRMRVLANVHIEPGNEIDLVTRLDMLEALEAGNRLDANSSRDKSGNRVFVDVRDWEHFLSIFRAAIAKTMES